jgi:O-acetyl-ADP-ribose deacetylase (regulator of RNase III)
MNERTYIINTSELVVRFGNILDSEADVIVSSDDNAISMGGGVSGAILSKGGQDIIKDAHKKIPAELGDAIVTTAGDLPQKYVFHCVTLDYANGERHAPDKPELQQLIVRRSVEKCLQLMALLDMESIAFPSIGAGLAKFPIEDVAASMVEILTSFLYTTSNRYRIELYLFDRYNKMTMMDYMVFFENIATNIKLLQIKYSPTEQHCTKKEPQRIKTSVQVFKGRMAVLSPSVEHKVFVSYSRKDVNLARVFCKQMDKLGISYWIDIEGRYHGEDFKEIIVDAIESTQLVLFLSSKNSNESTYVQQEISYAISAKIKVLPIHLDDSPYAKCLRLDLNNKQWIDYTKNKKERIRDFVNTLQLQFGES